MAGNTKILNIPSRLDISFFNNWLVFTQPLHKLKDNPRKVLGAMLYERYRLSHTTTSEKTIYSVMNTTETRKQIREYCGVGVQQFAQALAILRKAKILDGVAISPLYIPNVNLNDESFRIIINFDFSK